MPAEILALTLLAAAAFVASVVACVALSSAWRSQRQVLDVAADQHEALMAFHAAGRSLAAHELEQLRISLAIKQAEAEKAGVALRMREMDRAPVPDPPSSPTRGRFGSNGVVVGPDNLDGV